MYPDVTNYAIPATRNAGGFKHGIDGPEKTHSREKFIEVSPKILCIAETAWLFCPDVCLVFSSEAIESPSAETTLNQGMLEDSCGSLSLHGRPILLDDLMDSGRCFVCLTLQA